MWIVSKKMVKKFIISVFVLFFLVVPVFAFVDFIEEDIGDYQYQENSLPLGVAHQELTYANYQLRGTDKTFQVRILPYENSSSLNDYLTKKYYELTIKPKKYGVEIVYAERDGENLFWINGNNIIFVGSERGNPYNFPEEVIKAYLDAYPKECNLTWCSEKLCDKIFWSQAHYSGDVYRKHNGFTILCKDRVMYGKEGKITKPDLTFEQFKHEINRNLFSEMYFSEEELGNIYKICIDDGFYKNEGLPLEGFLKDCYDIAYSQLGGEIEENNKIDETSIDVCESVRLTVEENNYDDNLIYDLVDCRIEKELERREKEREVCKKWKEGDEAIAGCDEYGEEDDEADGIIILKPCTYKDLEEERECTSVKEKEVVEKEAKIEEYKEKQSESIFIRIISFFGRLFKK